MSTWLQEVRYAIRMLARNPGFTAVAVLTLALGIGANTAIFSAVYGILFRPLPYHDAGRLVTVWTRAVDRPGSQFPVSYPDLLDWRNQSQTIEGFAAYGYNVYKVAGPSSRESERAAIVTSDFFTVLGVSPVHGRVLLPEDERVRTVVLGHSLWQRLYSGDPAVLGQSLRLNDDDFTIVGVMPPEFRYPTPDVTLWVSMADIFALSGKAGVADWVGSRSLRGYRPVARLKEGVSLEQAQAEMDAIEERLGQQHREDSGLGVLLKPLRQEMVGKVERPLMMLLMGVGFVLLIACVNVANLMLSRATERSKEMAIRRALGANSRRLARQVLTESMLLALIGGGLGVLLAMWGVESFLRLSPAGVPRLESVRIDTTVLLFALATTAATGLLFGLAPALRTARSDLYGSLREGSRDAGDPSGSRRARQILVVAEVALAVVLVVGAGLMINSFVRLMRVDPGFAPDRLLTLWVGISLARYPETELQIRYLDSVLERIRVVPGVEEVGASTSLPPNHVQQKDGFSLDDEPPSTSNASAWFMPATPRFIEALGLPVLSGRTFNETDGPSQTPVAVINRSLSEAFFGGTDPLGHRINISGRPRMIVGVVGDTKFEGLASPAGFQVYVPFAQNPFPGMRLVVRSNVEPSSLIGSVREAMGSVDADESGSGYMPMSQILSASINEPRFYTTLVGAFGVVALALASVGIFGVISYSVSRRTKEIGVRVALGASKSSVVGMVLQESLRVIVTGLVLGVAAAVGLTRLLAGLLYEVRPADPATIIGVVLLLLGVGVIAALIPARRAAKVDPMVALRYE